MASPTEYINIPSFGANSWKSPVATAVDLPANGNKVGDVRVVQDTGIIYEWNGSSWVGTSAPGSAVTSLNGLVGAVTLIAGANITITPGASTLTISSLSGGGGGISRSVSSVSTATAAGATAKTDYVYFVSGTTTLTLPTAVSNSNLYTVKNTGGNTVTIATTSSQTIDGSLTITLPVANTSVDIVSDGSNWRIV